MKRKRTEHGRAGCARVSPFPVFQIRTLNHFFLTDQPLGAPVERNNLSDRESAASETHLSLLSSGASD